MATHPSSTAGTTTTTTDVKQITKPLFSVLFVCTGNVCRSPAAEAIFRKLVHATGLSSNFVIDSAGTRSLHEGTEADSRMVAAAKRCGVEVTSFSRQIRPSDFKEFDLILAMDKYIEDDLFMDIELWSLRHNLPDDSYDKVKLVCSYCKKHPEKEIPDPCGTEKALDILEDACESLLASILADNSLS